MPLGSLLALFSKVEAPPYRVRMSFGIGSHSNDCDSERPVLANDTTTTFRRALNRVRRENADEAWKL